MKNQKLFTVSNILTAFCLTLFVLTGAVIFTLNFRLLYVLDVKFLDIAGQSGISETDIFRNYHALIDYNSIFMRGDLQFPTLAMSESGRIHFEEVKNIFVGVQILFGISLVGTIISFVLKLRKKNTSFLTLSSIFCIGVPSLLGILIASNWDAFFVGFHKLFFRNDYWIFSAETDPVITILPDAFFMHCALMILALVFLGSLLFFLVGRTLSKKLKS
ncbi:TIGR01906 family membrane protein [Scatolibacter rhodanostii]|uniref:TIGR01906 family membrane protein n=1 Tax=Scatolibacter rhodanostii TaxID=2014781 RepID=UPI000C089CAE|nr:TIGR01906 family membrane protein [Scatolibacter rhodanostii]